MNQVNKPLYFSIYKNQSGLISFFSSDKLLLITYLYRILMLPQKSGFSDSVCIDINGNYINKPVIYDVDNYGIVNTKFTTMIIDIFKFITPPYVSTRMIEGDVNIMTRDDINKYELIEVDYGDIDDKIERDIRYCEEKDNNMTVEAVRKSLYMDSMEEIYEEYGYN